MSRLFRSRLLWLTIGVLTLAGTVFWLLVAIAAATMALVAGGTDPDPDDLSAVAVTVALLATAGGAVLGVVLVVIVGRGRARRWVQLREQMVRDATTLPDTYLARVLTPPNPAAGGHVQAVDLLTGHQGPLWLPGWNLPRRAVVCFTMTPSGGQVRAWMTGKLWRTTSRETRRIQRQTSLASTRAEPGPHGVDEREFRVAADAVVAEAERILRERDRHG